MSEITSAIKQICEEKNLSYEAVIATIESALAAAYRKDYGEKNQNIKVEFDPETAASKVFDIKTVVEDVPEEEEEDDEEAIEEKTKPVEDQKKKVKEDLEEGEEEKRFNPKTEIQIFEAKKIKKSYKIGDEIKTPLEVPEEYGRMAAQTAKQVIIQRLREAERDMVFEEFKDKENEVITGVVQRREGRVILVDLGKAIGIILPEDQVKTERYNSGERIKVYVREVKITPKGPEILLSRTSEEILKKIFYLEIPEISNGLIEIKAVAREAGSRSKVAVQAESDNIDPIGSCVGQRGSRIQTIISELGGEKIDIISYEEEIPKFIANALAPAKVNEVDLNEEQRTALVKVDDDQLSLAIGNSGQNVRLAARLTGWKIDIAGAKSGKNALLKEEAEEVEEAKEAEEAKEVEEIKEANKEEAVEEKEEKEKKKEKEEKKKTKEKDVEEEPVEVVEEEIEEEK
ncbi:MAG: transcription termination factor NusA [bacterium]